MAIEYPNIPSTQSIRIIVIGTSGAGKTDFSKSLADILEVPHIELDAIYWKPGWTPREKTDYRNMVEKIVTQKSWIIDGNYSVVRDIIWPKASFAIWLNYSFLTSFSRVLKRTLHRVIEQEELFSGNHESFRNSFLSKDSLLWWVITTYSRRKREFRYLFDTHVYLNLSLIEFREPDQVEQYLLELETKI